jgi:hypothetical protein
MNGLAPDAHSSTVMQKMQTRVLSAILPEEMHHHHHYLLQLLLQVRTLPMVDGCARAAHFSTRMQVADCVLFANRCEKDGGNVHTVPWQTSHSFIVLDVTPLANLIPLCEVNLRA